MSSSTDKASMLHRVMMIAGEASGDLHGSGVVRELKRCLPSVDVFGMGGDKMKSEGMELVHHMSSMAFMGFIEVVRHLGTIKRTERDFEGLLDARRPGVLVLIDYPGFNLRFARLAKQRGIKVLYYISPQVWAWRRGRVKTMRRLVDKMKVVFPFEVEIYRREGIDVEFVGHPLAESLGTTASREDFFRFHGLDPSRKLLALFPGSRKQELENILPVMARTAVTLTASTGVQAALGVAPSLSKSLVRRFIPGEVQIVLVEHGTYDLMSHADAAIVTSGTATLETGWFGTPMAVVYKTSLFSYLIGRLMVRVRNIGMVNILAGRTIVPEFIQHQLKADRLASAVGRMLTDEDYARRIRQDLAVIRTKLGEPGASLRVAQEIIALGSTP